MSEGITGRRVFVGLGLVVVLLSGLVGLFVGANSAGRLDQITVLGSVALPATPVAMGLYGAGLAAVVVVGLFGAVTLATRFDRDA